MKAPFAARKAIFLAALFSGIVAGGGAHAATLVSPSLIARAGAGDLVACIIVNASTKDITATVEVMSFEGAVLKQRILTMTPGLVRDASLGGIPGGYCRFSGKFTGKKVRTSINVIDSGGQNIAVAPAE